MGTKLSPYQQAVSDLARSLGLRGQAEQQVYGLPQFQELLNRVFGEIPLPAGIDPSQIISRTGQNLQYKDAEGYIHNLERNVNGLASDVGKVKESSTNRPAILPPSQEQAGAEKAQNLQLLDLLKNYFNQGVPNAPQLPDFSFLQNQLSQFPKAPQLPDYSGLIGQLNQGFGNAPSLPDISAITGGLNNLTGQYNDLYGKLTAPQQLQALQSGDLANLNAIRASAQADSDKLFQDQQGALIAQLYGRGINASTTANAAAADFTTAQQRANLAINADAASRQLGLQQYLTGQYNQNLGTAGGLLGQQGQLALGQGQLALDQGKLALDQYLGQGQLNLSRLGQLGSVLGQQGQLALAGYGAENDVRTNQLAQLNNLLQYQGSYGLNAYNSQQGLQQNQIAQALQQLAQLNNLDLNRQSTNASLGLQQQSLNQQLEQFYQQLSLQQEQQRFQERQAQGSLFNNILRGIGTAVSIGAAPFTGGTSLFGLLGNLGGRGTTSSNPVIGF